MKIIFKHNKIENLSEEININIYRIIQEGMNNCLKHADASEVHINLIAGKGNLKISFSDNGKGFDTKMLNSSKQFGIVGMRERIQGLNGKFELQSNVNGTIITGLIPIKKK